MRVIKICWDVDYDARGELLPREMEIPDGIKEEDIPEYLFDVTGVSHDGYVLIR